MNELELIKLYCQLNHQHLDLDQLKHQFAMYDEQSQPKSLDLGEVVSALQSLEFDATLKHGNRHALSAATFPALMPTRDGGLMLVGKMETSSQVGTRVVLQKAGQSIPNQVTLQEFDQLFADKWIEAKPQLKRNSQAVTADAEQEIFGISWFWASLSKYKSLMGEVLIASLFVQIIALITPLIFQVVIDKVLTHRTLSTLDVMVVALLGASIFEVALGAMRHFLLSHTTNRVDVELGSKLFKHLLHLPLAYFESRRSGDTVARVRELDNARNFLTGQALTSWLDVLFVMVYLSVMLYYSVALTMVVIAALPIFWGASALITPVLRKKLEDKFSLGADNQTYLVETVTSMETLKSLAVEPQWQREWDRRLSGYMQTSFEGGHLGNATHQFINLTSKLLTVALLWLGARLVIEGQLTVGGLIAFNMLSGRVNAPILKLSSLWQDYTQMKVSIKRLGDIMNAPTEPTFKANLMSQPTIQGRVTFEHVAFRYCAQAPEVLSDLSFDVQVGEVVGIVGVSGAGKTTMMRLIQRLYIPQRGRILIDGMDLNIVSATWLRRQMGVVGQDTQLFNRSVRENISLVDASLGMDAITGAAKLAGAHDFIVQLPQGYDTVIGERGSKLSGGQRARIAIARALVRSPQVLLLDEATASLDYESEYLIHNNMSAIFKGRTVFIVAHRLSTLRLVDRILVVERGRLIETGHHNSLLEQNGRYASLYKAHQALELKGAAV
jgi:subfamily B ATP-binding cassette protein HlyB/CyaB